MTSGPDGGQPTDYLLKEIERELCEDERLAELHVQLSARSGRIFVRGDVTSQARRATVLEIVSERCPDCTVVDELSVSEDGLSMPPARHEEIR